MKKSKRVKRKIAAVQLKRIPLRVPRYRPYRELSECQQSVPLDEGEYPEGSETNEGH